MRESNEYFLGLGSNLGNREENLLQATEKITSFADILDASSIYETEPVGFKKQDLFLNMVIKISTFLCPEELLVNLKKIEKEMGREKTFRNGPRKIDLDILLFNEDIFENKDLTIPHKKMHLRAFVLAPLIEIAAQKVHPGLKKNLRKIFKNLKSKESIKLWKEKT